MTRRRSGRHLADQAAARFDRAVPQRWPRGTRGTRDGGDRCARSLSSTAGGSGRGRTRGRRRHSGNRRGVGEGFRPRDEGGGGQACRTRASTVGRLTRSCAENSGRDFHQTFAGVSSSNVIERHAQASHPSSIGPCGNAGAFFVSIRVGPAPFTCSNVSESDDWSWW